MIIDFHAHCFPDDLAERAVGLLAQRSDLTPHLDGTVSLLRASMQRAGIDFSVLMPVAVKPGHVRNTNLWARQMCGDGILSFAALHPACADFEDEIARIRDAGFRGVKLHPEYQEFWVDDETLRPFYRALGRSGLATLFHAGVDLGLPDFVRCTPGRMARALEWFEGGTVILAHFGAYQMPDEVERWLVGREVFFDTSFARRDLPPETQVRMIRGHGAGRFLFGTDSPWDDQAESLAALRGLALADAERAAILGGNAAALLGLGP